MRVIYKVPIKPENRDEIKCSVVPIQSGAELLTVAMQGNVAVAWFLVNPEVMEYVNRKIWVLGTGREFEECEVSRYMRYITTIFHGPFVWHIFDGGID